MNAFANTLFNMLLGWTRTFIYGVWSALTNEDTYQAAKWLGKNWFWVAAVLVLLGVAIDFAVWMVRWRPYYLWHLPFSHRLRNNDDALDERFETGYQDAVDYEDGGEWQMSPQPDRAREFEQFYQYEYQPAPQADTSPARQRRADKYKHRRFRVLDTVRQSLAEDEDEAVYLDELPPPVDRRSAFYQPVYPEYEQPPAQQPGDRGYPQ